MFWTFRLVRGPNGAGVGRRREGKSFAFTIVELLVVIGVIAVLLAILLPALARARKAAEGVACMSALRQMGLANQMYLNEFRDWFVPAKWGFNENPAAPWPMPPAGLPAPTIATLGWTGNPAFRRNLGLPAGTTRVPYRLVCPGAVLALQSANKLGFEPGRSVGYNITGLSWYSEPTIYYTGYKRRQVHRGAEKLMFADATDAYVNYSGSARYETLGEVYGPPDPVVKTGITAYRHQRGANVVYFDGHGEWLAKGRIIFNQQLWYAMK